MMVVARTLAYGSRSIVAGGLPLTSQATRDSTFVPMAADVGCAERAADACEHRRALNHHATMSTPSASLPLSAVGAAAVATLLLAACQSAPPTGTIATAEVVAVVESADRLRGALAELHPALRAGVTRDEVRGGRLALGRCVDVDPTDPARLLQRRVSVRLPAGAAAPATLVEATAVAAPAPGDASPAAAQWHAEWRGIGPALDASSGVRPFGANHPLEPLCRPSALPAGVVRVALQGLARVADFDLAAAELARHDQFTRADFAAGRVLRLRCELKVADGTPWRPVQWLALAPEGLAPREGDRVRLRAGAADETLATHPLAEVIERLPAVADARGPVRCY